MRQFLGKLFEIVFPIFIMVVAMGVCLHSASAGTYIGYGVGVGHSAEHGATETKVLNLGYRDDLFLGLSYQMEVGYFNDIAGNGRKSSAWVGPSLGVEVNAYPLTLRQMIGPSFLSTTDSYLGGHFQFNNDLYVGLKDKQDRSIGVNYKHLSSAGIYQPNIGRDLILVQVGLPL